MSSRVGLATLILAVMSTASTARAEGCASYPCVVTLDTQSAFVDPATAPMGFDANGLRVGGLHVNVFLPAGYDGETRFPVLYLLPGYDRTYSSWVDRGRLLSFASEFPAIIVMPDGGRGLWSNWWNEGARGDPAWERYHLDELIPIVENRFKIRSGRRWHAIAGFSNGGYGAAFYASQRPGYFGSVAMLSPAPLALMRLDTAAVGEALLPTLDLINGRADGLPPVRPEDAWGDRFEQSFYWQGHDPTTLVENLAATRIFVSHGDGVPTSAELNASAGDTAALSLTATVELWIGTQVMEFLRAAHYAGIEPESEVIPGTHTEDIQGPIELANAMEWDLFARVPSMPTSWDYRTVAQTGQMWDLSYGFVSPPTTVEHFRRAGKTLTGVGTGTVTITQGNGQQFTVSLPFTRQL